MKAKYPPGSPDKTWPKLPSCTQGEAHQFDTYSSRRRKKFLSLPDAIAKMTKREEQVHALHRAGRSTKEIAKEMNISTHTVKIYVGRLRIKADANQGR